MAWPVTQLHGYCRKDKLRKELCMSEQGEGLKLRVVATLGLILQTLRLRPEKSQQGGQSVTLHRKISVKVEVLGKETRGSITFSILRCPVDNCPLSSRYPLSIFF